MNKEGSHKGFINVTLSYKPLSPASLSTKLQKDNVKENEWKDN